jgi:hypothetical protein
MKHDDQSTRTESQFTEALKEEGTMDRKEPSTQNETQDTSESDTPSENTSEAENQPTDALKEKCESIRKMMCSADTRDAGLHYNIGAQVKQAMDDCDKYGKAAVEYIASKVGCTAVNLYDHARVARTWTPAEKFEELSKLPTKWRTRLTFTHFVILAKVTDSTAREDFMKKAREEGYSVRELEDAVKGVKKGKRDGIARLSASLTSTKSKFDENIDGVVAELSASDVSKGLRDRGRKLRDLLVQVRDAAAQGIEELERALEPRAPAPREGES